MEAAAPGCYEGGGGPMDCPACDRTGQLPDMSRCCRACWREANELVAAVSDGLCAECIEGGCLMTAAPIFHVARPTTMIPLAGVFTARVLSSHRSSESACAESARRRARRLRPVVIVTDDTGADRAGIVVLVRVAPEVAGGPRFILG